jgi:hypothetical protein
VDDFAGRRWAETACDGNDVASPSRRSARNLWRAFEANHRGGLARDANSRGEDPLLRDNLAIALLSRTKTSKDGDTSRLIWTDTWLKRDDGGDHRSRRSHSSKVAAVQWLVVECRRAREAPPEPDARVQGREDS